MMCTNVSPLKSANIEVWRISTGKCSNLLFITCRRNGFIVNLLTSNKHRDVSKEEAVNIMITSADKFLQAKVKSVDIVRSIGYDEQMTNIMKRNHDLFKENAFAVAGQRKTFCGHKDWGRGGGGGDESINQIFIDAT